MEIEGKDNSEVKPKTLAPKLSPKARTLTVVENPAPRCREPPPVVPEDVPVIEAWDPQDLPFAELFYGAQGFCRILRFLC